MAKWDFSGWATKNNVRCSDGRTIMKDAFAHQDGKIVPLMWNHQHNDPSLVLGHALLENRPEGVYMYGSFNDTESGKEAKKLVQHGDVDAISIFANHLEHEPGKFVKHGMIREVSLVLAGANPEAYIENVMTHSDDGTEIDTGYVNIYTGENIIIHADSDEEKEEEPVKETEVEKEPEEVSEKNDEQKEDTSAESNAKDKAEVSEKDEKKEEEVKMEENKVIQHADNEVETEETVQDVINTMNEKQKKVLYAMVGAALEGEESEGGEEDMKHNVFDTYDNESVFTLSHSDMESIIADAKSCGSLKESVMAHAAEYGIEDIDILFPDAQAISNTPEFIQREMTWVDAVIGAAHHTPFSRVKSIFANITEDEARAKGYIKGKQKKNEVFKLLKRATNPTTVYKLQKLDRDDILDITTLDVVAFLKPEMRMMLDEELARAVLLGDGRDEGDDKINEDCIRPIVNDDALFTIRWTVKAGANDNELADNFITAAVKSRKNYKGSGNPVLFTTEDMLTTLLLLKDGIGHRIYKTEDELATALRVKKIITVPPMEGFKDKDNKDVYGIIVNMSDYNVGADKGGNVSFFDDFDIDFNQQKFLIETRCSGALIKPFSAIVLRAGATTGSEEPSLDEAIAGIAG